MAIYEYRCNAEGSIFQLRRPMEQIDSKAVCPSCGSDSKRVLSLVAALVRNEDGNYEPMGEMSGGCCGGACGCGSSLN